MQIKQRVGDTPPARAERLPVLGVVLGPGHDALAAMPHAEALRRRAGRADAHILAVRFLSRFVAAGVPWVHIVLTSATNKGSLAHIPTKITGFGVGLVLDHHLTGPA